MLRSPNRDVFLLLACLLVTSGCEKMEVAQQVIATEPPLIQIAICDIDEIAKELGYIDELNQILTRQRTLLNNEIRKLEATRQAAFNEKLEAAGEFPDDEQKRELAVMQAQARQLVLQTQNRARQIFAGMRDSLVQQIRTKIKKPVDQVATKKGINIVITDREESVLYVASAADITPEVLSAARNADLGKLELQAAGNNDASVNQSDATAPQNELPKDPLESSNESEDSSLFDK